MAIERITATKFTIVHLGFHKYCDYGASCWENLQADESINADKIIL